MMRKDEFLSRLEVLLSDISAEEREEAMAFYRSYFEDAGEANEAGIIAELESPENVAEIIKRDLGMVTVTTQDREHYDDATRSNPYGNYNGSQSTQPDTDKKNSWLVPLLIVIAVLTFPTWFSLLAGLFGTVLGLAVSLIAITFTAFVMGVVFVGLGITMLTGLSVAVVSIPVGLAFVGVGLLVLAIAMLLLLECVAVFGRFLPWACKGIYHFCKKIFAKKEAQAV